MFESWRTRTLTFVLLSCMSSLGAPGALVAAASVSLFVPLLGVDPPFVTAAVVGVDTAKSETTWRLGPGLPIGDFTPLGFSSGPIPSMTLVQGPTEVHIVQPFTAADFTVSAGCGITLEVVPSASISGTVAACTVVAAGASSTTTRSFEQADVPFVFPVAETSGGAPTATGASTSGSGTSSVVAVPTAGAGQGGTTLALGTGTASAQGPAPTTTGDGKNGAVGRAEGLVTAFALASAAWLGIYLL
ncbi:hypothetical protein C8Q77DRAFT_1073811 [Trametes polyzona]|nr:hypothetical protein C8Q77DRAFT_1073811 [Trametes polyzona]